MKKLIAFVVLVASLAVLFISCGSSGGGGGSNDTSANSAPIANAGPDQKVAAAGTLVTLDGSGSSDPDNNALTYAWSITERPFGSTAVLSNTTGSNPTFTPDKAGAYVLSLTVNDGIVSSPADSVSVRAGMPVPDTGQTTHYSTNFGDDGSYTINPMSFTDNGNGTIFDNVTGLTWQKCSMGTSGLYCTAGTAAKYTWVAAGTTCNNLNLAGNGWRLPALFELMTLVDYGYGQSGPAINSTYFPNTGPGLVYWSSTTYAPDTTAAWDVDFGYDGNWGGFTKALTLYVRCVRE